MIMDMKENKYLIVKGGDGFGNRILTFLEAIVYAQATNRKIIVDWRDGFYAQREVNSFFSFFSCPLINKIDLIPENRTVYPSVWKDNVNKNVYDLRGNMTYLEFKKALSINIENMDYGEEELFLFDSDFHIKYEKLFDKLPEDWKIDNRNDFIRLLLKNYLHLKDDILKRINDFKREFFIKKVIGVHIRSTDNQHCGEVNSVNIKKFPPLIQRTIEENPDALFFLCTDNKDILDEYKSKYSNIIYTKKFLVNDKNTGLHRSHECKDKNTMAIEALVDLYLLSECDILLYSRKSSYGRLASFLSKTEVKNIISIETIK